MPQSTVATTTGILGPASAQCSRASSTRRRSEQHLRPPSLHRNDTVTVHSASTSTTRQRSSREKRRGRSSSRRRNAAIPKAPANGQWKKLLWVKQSYPDNYTDEETFLDHLQRNPRLRPYEFWPLVADSTIIVQHVCSVLIFVCCFAAIFEKRVSPQRTAAWATACTVAGWVFRDYWQSRGASDEEGDRPQGLLKDENTSTIGSADPVAESDFGAPSKGVVGIPVTAQSAATAPDTAGTSRAHSRSTSLTSISMNGTVSDSASQAVSGDFPSIPITPSYIPPYNSQAQKSARMSPRMQERLATAKSAILIYCSLLGLSPILKSLTKSTSSDSIWALSSWLLILNVFTFDYGAGPEVKFPASLSTNAALMASTVLASRLKSTTDVFSLTLFSIEVFGLFPVFRRHLRHHSWIGHVCLTILLVVLASGGLGMTISGGGLGFGLLGVILGVSIIGLSMGMTSWWLIGLQRYKNEIHGPWDPARPIIRRQWP